MHHFPPEVLVAELYAFGHYLPILGIKGIDIPLYRVGIDEGPALQGIVLFIKQYHPYGGGFELETLHGILEPGDQLGADEHAPFEHQVLVGHRLGNAMGKAVLTAFHNVLRLDAHAEPRNFLEADIRIGAGGIAFEFHLEMEPEVWIILGHKPCPFRSA
jgi:hypothetical protein